MLKLTIQGDEDWDDESQTFVYPNTVTLELEHSLLSLSKWEEIWEKPFLSPDEKSSEETISYIQVMCLTPDVDPDVWENLSQANYKQINDYMDAKRSATWFTTPPGAGRSSTKREIITSELLYYWIFASENIDVSVQEWHLNRLFTLLKVFNEKNAPPKKMKKQDAAAQRRMLNEQRKTKLNTAG